MSEKEQHNHRRIPDPTQCWCCLKKLPPDGTENVIRMNLIYTVIGSSVENGGEQEKQVPVTLNIHAKCFQDHHLPERIKTQVKIECEKCGVFSMARKLPDGTPIHAHCGCVCHTGSKECSLIPTFGVGDIPIVETKEKELVEGQCSECGFVKLKETQWSFICTKCGKAVRHKK